MKYANGSEPVFSCGPWAQLIAVRKALCDDDVARYARVIGQPDTAWTIPARVNVRGKSVTGFLTMTETYKDKTEEGYAFHANKFGKNGHLIQDGGK